MKRKHLAEEIKLPGVDMISVWQEIEGLGSINPFSHNPINAGELMRLLYNEDGSGKEIPYREVGIVFGVSGERIMQLRAKCLRTLNHPVRKKRYTMVGI